MTLGIGLVGLGRHGSRYASHLAKGDVPGVRLAAVCRRDRAEGEGRARELGCRFHADVQALAQDPDVDAVLVASPGGAHAEHVRVAVRAGKPVLVEKPLSHSPDDARALVAEARALEARVMVAHTLRWEPVFATAARLAPELGGAIAAQTWFRRGDFATRASADSQERDHNRALFACGIHHLDWSGLVFPRRFDFAFTREPRGADGLVCNAMLVAQGISFVLDVNLVDVGSDEGFMLMCAHGSIRGNRPRNELAVIRGSSHERIELPPPSPSLPRVVASFRDFVAGKIANPVPLEAGLRAVVLADACARSIALRGPVNIPEDHS